MKKVVEYHCHTEDCEDFIINSEFSKEQYMSLKYRRHKTWADYLSEDCGHQIASYPDED